MAEMTDQRADLARPGDKSERKISTANAAATGAGAALTIGFSDWFLQCMVHGHWTWVMPNQQLIEMAAPIVLLPIGLWLSKVLGLIGTIITNHLQRDAGGDR